MADLDVELPEAATAGTTREERAAAWAEMTDRLSPMLDELLASDVYGRGISGRPAAPTSHGVYLFSDEGRPLYVGRTGKTERSVKAGKSSSSGFRARLAGHTRPSSGIDSASFALRLAMQWASEEGLQVAAERDERRSDPRFEQLFTEAKERSTQMEFRVREIDEDRDSAVFEVYAAFVLATPFNSFATS